MGLALKKFRKQAEQEAEEISQRQAMTFESVVKKAGDSIKGGIDASCEVLQDQETIFDGIIANVGQETRPKSTTLGPEKPESDEGSIDFGRHE